MRNPFSRLRKRAKEDRLTNNLSFYYQYGDTVRLGHIAIPKSDQFAFDSVYLFCFHKSGSVLVNSVADAIAQEANIPNLSLPSDLFNMGVSGDCVLFDLPKFFRPKGYLYSGFRGVMPAMRGMLSAMPGQKILVVRDPRDILVSNFFSVKYSHHFPDIKASQFTRNIASEVRQTNEGIDEYCLQSYHWLLDSYLGYKELVDGGYPILKYEDFVFDKPYLVQKLCEFGRFQISGDAMARIAKQFDVVPAKEDVHAHIRQVHPGDHKRKLSETTIRSLNSIFADFLHTFNYG